MNHLGDWTSYWARRTPDNVAVSEPLRGKRLTWLALDRRANRLARALAGACGVEKGDRVVILAQNRVEHFELLFACAKLGALFTAVNWRLAAAELDAILADAEPKALLYDKPCAPLAAQLTYEVPHRVALDEPSAGGRPYEDLLADGSDAPPPVVEIGLEDPIVVCYTSGTTGRAKGALLSHRQLVFNALSTDLAIGVSSADSSLVFMPLFHTGGLNCLATPLLLKGGRVVLMPGFDAAQALALSDSERITIQMAVPTIFQMILDAGPLSKMSATRMALCGGAPCPLPLIEAYQKQGILFRQGYGLTEVGPNCFSLTETDALRKLGSVGWPNFYIHAQIVDDAGNEVPPGEIGELRLAGPMVTLGYFRNPSATADAFRGTRWFHTGDLVRMDDEGYYYIVDRKKDMFISGGENVYPAEVEQALARMAGIGEVCVIGVPDSRWGEVGRAIIVRGEGGAALDEAAVLGWLQGKLAKYKIPKSVVFADALPRNAGGKLLRPEIRGRWGAK